ncbi:hypothetical protein TRFO_15040 [Tritrichomonas foetus]|uniref:Uncharacterized protein n=1 Tax=Tritrichomonas foetus TaxID=1144522 RepID=A0A1J4KXU6_9EUKA|nr:hypothetical protein TRFO_15040 [Tritrichomonas foetus]|eukprot:OHT14526.1 hypothetical protein TRFO_15040 [Tritrichomonas foetus]
MIDPNDERRKKKLHVFKFDVEKMINDRQQSNFESFDKFEIKSLSIDIQRDDSTFLDTNFEESDFLFHDDMMDMKLSDDLLDERNVHLLL